MVPETPNPARPVLPARLLVPWALLLALVVLVEVGLGVDAVDYPSPFGIAHTYRLLLGAELFFVLVVAPLAARGDGAWRGGLLELALLMAIAAPVVVIAAWVSDCDWAPVAVSQGYVLAAAALVAGYLRADRDGRARAWYWLAVGAFGAGCPFLAFVVGDLLRARLAWLTALSPFWVADRLSRSWSFGWEWALAFAGLVLLAAVFSVLARLRR